MGNGLAAGFLTGKGRASDREGFLSAEAREAAKTSSGKVAPAQASTVCFWEEDLLEEGGEVDTALAAAEAAGCDMILQELKGVQGLFMCGRQAHAMPHNGLGLVFLGFLSGTMEDAGEGGK